MHRDLDASIDGAYLIAIKSRYSANESIAPCDTPGTLVLVERGVVEDGSGRVVDPGTVVELGAGGGRFPPVESLRSRSDATVRVVTPMGRDSLRNLYGERAPAVLDGLLARLRAAAAAGVTPRS